MPTLKELLDELEINTDDDDDDSDDKNKNQFDIESLPDDGKVAFKTLQDTIEDLKNQNATKDLTIKTMKDTISAIPRSEKKKETDNQDDEKILGVLDKNDPYAPAFQTLAEMIKQTAQKIPVVDEEKDFEENLKAFAKENPDIVRYVDEIQELVDEYPAMKKNIPKLYKFAKATGEGREKGKNKNQRSKILEGSGVGGSNTSQNSNVTSITEAFERAEKKLATN